MSALFYTGPRWLGPVAGAGRTPKERTELLLDALRRGARVDWEYPGQIEPGAGALTLPGTGHQMLVSAAEVSGAYRRIVRELMDPEEKRRA